MPTSGMVGSVGKEPFTQYANKDNAYMKHTYLSNVE